MVFLPSDKKVLVERLRGSWLPQIPIRMSSVVKNWINNSYYGVDLTFKRRIRIRNLSIIPKTNGSYTYHFMILDGDNHSFSLGKGTMSKSDKIYDIANSDIIFIFDGSENIRINFGVKNMIGSDASFDYIINYDIWVGV